MYKCGELTNCSREIVFIILNDIIGANNNSYMNNFKRKLYRNVAVW